VVKVKRALAILVVLLLLLGSVPFMAQLAAGSDEEVIDLPPRELPEKGGDYPGSH